MSSDGDVTDDLSAMVSPTRRATMSIAEERAEAQKSTFAKWANSILSARHLQVDDLCADFDDGVMLIELAELLTGKKAGKHSKSPKAFFAKSANLSIAFDLFHSDGLRIVNIGPQDILDHNEKITLALFWSLIFRYQIVKNKHGSGDQDSSAKKILLDWLRSLPNFDVQVNNFNNSWTSGEALWDLVDCISDGALSHMDHTRIPTKDIATAMQVAEQELGVPQLLSPEHMANASDELSLMTYISYFKEKMENINKAQAEATTSKANASEREFLEEEEEADEDSEEAAAAAELVNIDDLGLSSSSDSEEADGEGRHGGEASHSDHTQSGVIKGGSAFKTDNAMTGNPESERGFSAMHTSPYAAAGDNMLNSIADHEPQEIPPIATYESDTTDANEPSSLSTKVISPRVGLTQPYAMKEDRYSDISAASAGQHTDTSLMSSQLTPRDSGSTGTTVTPRDSGSVGNNLTPRNSGSAATALTPRNSGSAGNNLTPRGVKTSHATPRQSDSSSKALSPRYAAASATEGQSTFVPQHSRNEVHQQLQITSPFSQPKPLKVKPRSDRSDQEHLTGSEAKNSLKRPGKKPTSAARRRARDKAKAFHNRGRSMTLPTALQKNPSEGGPKKPYPRRNSLDSTLHDLLTSSGLESGARSDVDITPAPTPSLEFDTDGRPSLPPWMTEIGLLPPNSTEKQSASPGHGHRHSDNVRSHSKTRDARGSKLHDSPLQGKPPIRAGHNRTGTASDLLSNFDWLSHVQVDERSRPKKTEKAHTRSRTVAFNPKDLAALKKSSTDNNSRGRPPLTPRRKDKGHSRHKSMGAAPRSSSLAELTPFELWCMESAEANMASRSSDPPPKPKSPPYRTASSDLGSATYSHDTCFNERAARMPSKSKPRAPSLSRTQSLPMQSPQNSSLSMLRNLSKVQSDIPTRDLAATSTLFTNESAPTPFGTPAPSAAIHEHDNIRMDNYPRLPSKSRVPNLVRTHSLPMQSQQGSSMSALQILSRVHSDIPTRDIPAESKVFTNASAPTPFSTPAPPAVIPEDDDIRMDNSLDESSIPSMNSGSHSAPPTGTGVTVMEHPHTYTPAQTPEPFSQFDKTPATRQTALGDVGVSEEVVKTPNPTPAPPESMSAEEIQRTAMQVLADALLTSPKFQTGAHASPPPRQALPASEHLTPIRDKVFNFPALDVSDEENLPSPVHTSRQHFVLTRESQTPTTGTSRQIVQPHTRAQTLPHATARRAIHTPTAKRSLRDAERQLSLALRETEERQGNDGSDLSYLQSQHSREREERKEVLTTIVEDETVTMTHSAPVSRFSSKRNSISRASHGRARLRARKQFADMKRDASLSARNSDVERSMSDFSTAEVENRLRGASDTPDRKGHTEREDVSHFSDSSELQPLAADFPSTLSANTYGKYPDADVSSENGSAVAKADFDAKQHELQVREHHLELVRRSLALIQELEPRNPLFKLVVIEAPSLGFSFASKGDIVSSGHLSKTLTLGVPRDESKVDHPLETPRTPLALAHLRKRSSDTELELSSREVSPTNHNSSGASRDVFSFSPLTGAPSALSRDPNTPRAVHLALNPAPKRASYEDTDSVSGAESKAHFDSDPVLDSGRIVVTDVERFSAVETRGVKTGDVVELVQARTATLELLHEHEAALGTESGHKVCVVFRCQMEEKETDEEVNIQKDGKSFEEMTHVVCDSEFDSDEALTAMNPMWDPPAPKPPTKAQRSLRRVKQKKLVRGVLRKPGGVRKARTLPASLARPSRVKKRSVASKLKKAFAPKAKVSLSVDVDGETSFLSKLFTLFVTIALLGVVFAAGYRAGSGSGDLFPAFTQTTSHDVHPGAEFANPLAVSTIGGAPPFANNDHMHMPGGVRVPGDLTHLEETQDLILERLDDLEDVVQKRTAAILRDKRDSERGYLARFTSYVGNFFA